MLVLRRLWILLVLVTPLMSACGIKGPLYIPEKRYPQEPTSLNQTLPINQTKEQLS
jgi:predicted small lipoprotein YifL